MYYRDVWLISKGTEHNMRTYISMPKQVTQRHIQFIYDSKGAHHALFNDLNARIQRYQFFHQSHKAYRNISKQCIRISGPNVITLVPSCDWKCSVCIQTKLFVSARLDLQDTIIRGAQKISPISVITIPQLDSHQLVSQKALEPHHIAIVCYDCTETIWAHEVEQHSSCFKKEISNKIILMIFVLGRCIIILSYK